MSSITGVTGDVSKDLEDSFSVSSPFDPPRATSAFSMASDNDDTSSDDGECGIFSKGVETASTPGHLLGEEISMDEDVASLSADGLSCEVPDNPDDKEETDELMTAIRVGLDTEKIFSVRE